MAHFGRENLIRLLRSIDDPRCEIYLHLDKKWKDSPGYSDLCAVLKSSKLHLIERRRVNWGGGGTMIPAELALFSRAHEDGPYEYYHLLSGQDLCIKSQDEIFAFFAGKQKEFLTFCGKDWQKKAQDRVKYAYFHPARKGFFLFFNRVFRRLQALFGVDLRTKGIEYVGGSNWVSITDSFCEMLLENAEKIKRAFAHTFCADEIFIHTIAYNSSFKDRIYLLKIPEKNDDSDPDMNLANMRKIDWLRGSPYTFQPSDFDELVDSPCLFARKFNAENGLPDRILRRLGKDT